MESLGDLNRLGVAIALDNFDSGLIDKVKEWRKNGTNPYQEFNIHTWVEERLVFVGLVRRGQTKKSIHGYLLVMSDKEAQKRHDLRMDPRTPIQALQYHICVNNDGYYLKKDEEDIPLERVQRHDLHCLAKTKLTDYQLDSLALYCTFANYQLIRQDCLAFAKQMVEEIALNENRIPKIESKERMKHLTVISEENSVQSAEASSREDPDSSIAYVPAVLEAVSSEPNKYFKYLMPIVVALAAIGLVAKVYYFF